MTPSSKLNQLVRLDSVVDKNADSHPGDPSSNLVDL